MPNRKRDFSEIAGGAFERAVRRKLGVGRDFQISAEMEGGQEYQIGEMTWDTEPRLIRIVARPMKWQAPYGTWVLLADMERIGEQQERTFDSLPEVWEWLNP